MLLAKKILYAVFINRCRALFKQKNFIPYCNILVLKMKQQCLVVECHLPVVSGFSHDFFSSVCRSSFAVEGADCKVNEDVAKSIKDFHAAKKPIG